MLDGIKYIPGDGNALKTNQKKGMTAYDLAFVGVMAAIIYVVTMFRIPVGQSKIHLANAMCLLSGLLFGPVAGGLASGIGSALYDALTGGYDIVNVLITFVSKMAMTVVCGLIAGTWRKTDKSQITKRSVRIIIACIAGALTYVALYVLKTWIFQQFVYHYAAEVVKETIIAKTIPSLINAAAAVIVAPLLYVPLKSILKSIR